MADDLGIGDVSPTNPDCKIKTPHLQLMADQGITFFDAHSSSAVYSNKIRFADREIQLEIKTRPWSFEWDQ